MKILHHEKSAFSLLFFLLIPLVLIAACSDSATPRTSESKAGLSQPKNDYSNKKVMYINSYHPGLPWSDGVENGLEQVLNSNGVEYKTLYLNSKRNRSADFLHATVPDMVSRIENYQPDVLVVSDDNAFQYIVKEHYRDAEMPIVFCGVNWGVDKYDGPYNNTTGMVEVVLYGQSIRTVLPYAKGNRIGFLSENTSSERSNLENLTDHVGLHIEHSNLVDNFEDWKKRYVELQEKVDVIIIGVMGSFIDWTDSKQKQSVVDFVMDNTTVPTVTEHVWMVEFTLLAYGKIPEEQGEWAANAALQIIDGRSPSEIGVVKNRKGELAINSKLAEQLGVIFSAGVIKNAKVFH